MSEFYLENQSLNLNKQVFNFEYQQIEQVNLEMDAFWKHLAAEKGNDEYGVKSNHIYLQEKDMILMDVRNICTYFYQKHIMDCQNPQLKEFPFAQLKYRVCAILYKYLEQSVILDQVMETVVTNLMYVIKAYVDKQLTLYAADPQAYIQKDQDRLNSLRLSEDFTPETVFSQDMEGLLGLIYNLCKVRGYKNVVKYFPHEVRDLERVMFYLLWVRGVGSSPWEGKYVFLLWLSVIILVPFHLESIDSGIFSPLLDGQPGDMKHYLLSIGQEYLVTNRNSQGSACVFVSKYFQRTDILGSDQEGRFIEWCEQTFINNATQDVLSGTAVQQQQGILLALFEIFKIGQRERLQGHVKRVMQFIQLDEQRRIKDSCAIKHFKTKLTQRLALILLKPKSNSWLYKRDHKQMQVKAEGEQRSQEEEQQQIEQEEEENEEVDWELLEDILQYMLDSLKEKETVVRWSAAKGIGRIVSRLTRQEGEEVVAQLLEECFGENNNEHAWHGGCLALAELVRRGLVLPSQLPQVVQVVSKALLFEFSRGTYSVGSNVRDSACYVCWAFARVFEPTIMAPFIDIISTNLLLVSLFDREVNCRRAASAAFQEHVGRQGVFKNGIEILTEADYFTLGPITNAYLQVGPFVASFPAYFKAIVQHLTMNRLQHTDPNIRRNAAGALALVSVLDVDYVVNNTVGQLIGGVYSNSLEVRQGALVGLADLFLGLKGLGHQNRAQLDNHLRKSAFFLSLSHNEKKLMQAGEYRESFQKYYESIQHTDSTAKILAKDRDELLGIVEYIEKKRLFRGKGGDLMRVGVCRLVESIAVCRLDIGHSTIVRFYKTLDECIRNPIDSTQEAAILALEQLYAHPQALSEGAKILTKFLKNVHTDPNVAVTRGYSMALGCIHPSLMVKHAEEIFTQLSLNCHIKEDKQEDDSETRKFSVRSLEKVLKALLTQGNGQDYLQKTLNIFSSTVEDYSVDKRGDIGSVVREQTMESAYALLKHLKSLSKLDLLSPDMALQVLRCFLKQLVEKIDRIRLKAGFYLQKLVSDGVMAQMTDFPGRAALLSTFSQENIQQLANQVTLQQNEKFDASVLPAEALSDEAFIKNSEIIFYWNHPRCVYPNVVHLLSEPSLGQSLLTGLCISIGDLTESNQKHSLSALVSYSASASNVPQLMHWFNAILSTFAAQPRQIVPTFATLAAVLKEDSFSLNPEIKTMMPGLLNTIMAEIKGPRSIYKLMSIAQLVVAILNITQTLCTDTKKIIRYCMFHKFPKVRKTLVDAFYMLMMTDGEAMLGEQTNEELLDMMISTDWLEATQQDIDSLKTTFSTLVNL